MAFIDQHNAKISDYLGSTRFVWKLFNGKKIETPNDYPILFGVEMEYEVVSPRDIGDLNAKRIYRAQIANRLEPTYKKFAIAKHDGSLTNGFEIVSVPMSLSAHLEEWKPLLEIAADNGLAVRRTCGMHVHVSRELLTPLHIGKILSFIHDKKNNEFIKTIAGRTKPIYTGNHGEYNELSPKKISDVNHEDNRYAALNIRGAETIEFRLFKSTLSLDRMLANIEFCDSLVRFMWPGSAASIQELKKRGLELFFKYILENRKTYPHLADFMRENNYISWKKIPNKYQKKIAAPIEKTDKKELVKRSRVFRTRRREIY